MFIYIQILTTCRILIFKKDKIIFYRKFFTFFAMSEQMQEKVCISVDQLLFIINLILSILLVIRTYLVSQEMFYLENFFTIK